MPRFAPGELGGLLDGVSTCIVWLDVDATGAVSERAGRRLSSA
jgi:hypothetical protein